MDNFQTIEIVLVYKNGDDYFTEKVDAEKAGKYYVIKNIPAFAKNLAYGDVVSVEFEDGEFHFSELISESGHSVLHIVLFEVLERENVIKTLNDFGCGVNDHIANNYLVIDVPPLVAYSNIKEYLEQRSLEGVVDYAEACISKLHRSRLG